jgi:hypothetical protein
MSRQIWLRRLSGSGDLFLGFFKGFGGFGRQRLERAVEVNGVHRFPQHGVVVA